MREMWVAVPSNEDYDVSSHGRVRKHDTGQDMAIVCLGDGSLAVSLTQDKRQRPHMLRRLVAEAFCEYSEVRDDTVIHLNGDQKDCRAENLAWRPRWFAWKYTHQFNEELPEKYNKQVTNIVTGSMWTDIPAAGMSEGELWSDIWRSCVEGVAIYPHAHVYEIGWSAT